MIKVPLFSADDVENTTPLDEVVLRPEVRAAIARLSTSSLVAHKVRCEVTGGQTRFNCASAIQWFHCLFAHITLSKATKLVQKVSNREIPGIEGKEHKTMNARTHTIRTIFEHVLVFRSKFNLSDEDIIDRVNGTVEVRATKRHKSIEDEVVAPVVAPVVMRNMNDVLGKKLTVDNFTVVDDTDSASEVVDTASSSDAPRDPHKCHALGMALVTSSGSEADDLEVIESRSDAPLDLTGQPNEVLRLAVMNVTVGQMKAGGVEFFKDKSACVLCAIKWFKDIDPSNPRCSMEQAKKIMVNMRATTNGPNLDRLKHRSAKHRGHEVPACHFEDLLQILSNVPGHAAKVLRANMAEITARLIAGGEEVEEAARAQRARVDDETRDVAMGGIPSRIEPGRDEPPSRKRGRGENMTIVQPGLYLIDIGRVGDLKTILAADPTALPDRRDDVMGMGMEFNDFSLYKLGLSNNLGRRMLEHCREQLRGMSVVKTWSWHAKEGMLVSGEKHMREQVRGYEGCVALPNTLDWHVLPPDYDDVAGGMLDGSLCQHLVENDPYVKLSTSESAYQAKHAADAMQHQLELCARDGALALRDKDLAMALCQRDHQVEIGRLRLELKDKELEMLRAALAAR